MVLRLKFGWLLGREGFGEDTGFSVGYSARTEERRSCRVEGDKLGWAQMSVHYFRKDNPCRTFDSKRYGFGLAGFGSAGFGFGFCMSCVWVVLGRASLDTAASRRPVPETLSPVTLNLSP